MTDEHNTPLVFEDWIDCWRKISEAEYERNLSILEYMTNGEWEREQTQFDNETAYTLASLANCALYRLNITPDREQFITNNFSTRTKPETKDTSNTPRIEKFEDWVKHHVPEMRFSDEHLTQHPTVNVGVSRKRTVDASIPDTTVSLWKPTSKPVQSSQTDVDNKPKASPHRRRF